MSYFLNRNTHVGAILQTLDQNPLIDSDILQIVFFFRSEPSKGQSCKKLLKSSPLKAKVSHNKGQSQELKEIYIFVYLYLNFTTSTKVFCTGLTIIYISKYRANLKKAPAYHEGSFYSNLIRLLMEITVTVWFLSD